jgi:CheY-like chemotaxis protein
MRGYVLIVDDEFGLADVLASLLLEYEYEASVVINGKLALASLAARAADLVLTDLMMPVMDGPELIKHMRGDARFAAIPIVLMTALPEAIPTGDAQYDAVLVKPFPFAKLLDVLRTLIPAR